MGSPSSAAVRAVAAGGLLLSLLATFPASSAIASDGTDPDPGAVSVLGRGVLGRTDLLVRARVERVSRLAAGTQLGVLAVEETLRGPPPQGAVQVMTTEDGYFSRYPGEAVFFLRALRASRRYDCLAVMDLADADGAPRLLALRRVLEVEALPAERRAGALREVCFESLGARDAWTRRNAGRETAHLADTRPDAFTPEDLADLRRVAGREGDSVLRPLLVEAVASLHAASRRGRLGASQGGARTSLRGAPLLRVLRESADPAERRRAAEAVAAEEGAAAGDLLLGALASDPDAGVRGAVAGALVRVGGGPRVSEALLRALREEWDAGVRTAVVEALGELGLADAVVPLSELARRDPSLERVCLFGLARIRTPAALDALRGFRAPSPGPPGEGAGSEAAVLRAEADVARAALVDFLLSDDFLRQEEILRRVRERDRR